MPDEAKELFVLRRTSDHRYFVMIEDGFGARGQWVDRAQDASTFQTRDGAQRLGFVYLNEPFTVEVRDER